MPTIALSDAALALLRRHAEQQGGLPVDDSTREPNRELARDGLMIVGHSFTGGRESFYALTETGKKLATVLGRFPSPSPEESAIRDRQVGLGRGFQRRARRIWADRGHDSSMPLVHGVG